DSRLYCVCSCGDHRYLHSFPPRRSSDLWLGGNIALNSGADVQVYINGRPEESPWLDAQRAEGCGLLVVYSRVTRRGAEPAEALRSEEHTSELQSRENLVCRLLLEKKKST